MVKLYSTPYCVYCKTAKAFFERNGIAYEEYDVAEDEKARDEMIKKSGQLGVPVIEVGGEIIVGFDQRAIERALKRGK